LQNQHSISQHYLTVCGLAFWAKAKNH